MTQSKSIYLNFENRNEEFKFISNISLNKVCARKIV